MKRHLIATLLCVSLIAACATTEPTATPAPSTATPEPTATATPIPPTATDLPPTATATPTPTPEAPAATPTPSPIPTEQALPVPRFEPGTCRFQIPARPVECGYLIVPEDRSDPDGPTVSLHVAIFPSTSPDPEPDPVIYLMGGGGGNALNAADYYLRAVGYDIRQSRDFIMYNQRGTHYNQPLNFPTWPTA